MRVNHIFPDFLIIPEKLLKNYPGAKEFMLRKPHLYEYLKTGIKEMIFHEREHSLEGPAQRGAQKSYEKLKEQLNESLSLGKIIKKMVKGPRGIKEIRAERENIKKEFDRWKKELEKQVELQKIVASKEVDEEGVDKALAQPRKMPDIKKELNYLVYFTYYPFLKSEIISKLVKKYLQIKNELEKEYEEWKKKEKP